MSVLALDMACKTGWAHACGDAGLWLLPPPIKDETNGHRFCAFLAWLSEMADCYKYDAIVYEQAHHRGGPTTRLALGMVTVVEIHAANLGIRCKGYHSGTIKKHATGNGRADKPAMWAAAKARGIAWTPETDDIVDAIWLADLALNDNALFTRAAEAATP